MANNKQKSPRLYSYSILIVVVLACIGLATGYFAKKYDRNETSQINFDFPVIQEIIDGPLENITRKKEDPHPLSIDFLKNKKRQFEPFVVEKKNFVGNNFVSYLGYYYSDGLRINSLINLPSNQKSESSIPVILFLHGYIPPDQYRTEEKYIAYTNYFSSRGYAVFKIDLRGHGLSEGEPSGAYGSNDYAYDVLNALDGFKNFPKIRDIDGKEYRLDSENIGIWGHSMGGYLTLRSLIVNQTPKAAVIWAGVVGSHADLISAWRSRVPFPTSTNPARRWRNLLMGEYGSPEANPDFWASLSANTYLSDLKTPIQLHHAREDDVVPLGFSEKLHQDLVQNNKASELFVYENDDHNLANSFALAMERSVKFFDQYLKSAQ